MKISLADTMLVTVTGISIVFFVLILLVFVMYLFGKAASSGGKKTEKKAPKAIAAEQKPSSPPKAALSVPVGEDEGELIAVIAAAVQALGESTGKRYAVRGIRPSGARSAWAAAGIYENTRPF